MKIFSILRQLSLVIFSATFSLSAYAEEHVNLARSYLEKISNQDWESLYLCKSEKFKSLVSYDVFVKSMDESSMKYRVLNYNIKQTRVVDDRYVGITFSFVLGEKYGESGVLTMEDEQIWERLSDGGMVCLDLGMRMFFPFNAEHI